jgi:hypothetical protein
MEHLAESSPAFRVETAKSALGCVVFIHAEKNRVLSSRFCR